MKRREFIAGAIAAAATGRAAAQQGTKRPVLAIFSPAEPEALMHENGGNRYYRALYGELRRLGYVEGQNLTIDRYSKERNTAGPAALVAEVVAAKPDVIYVVGFAAMIFKKLTQTIPIVALTGDPVGVGLVQSLARPGGNITGVSVDTGPAIHAKRIEILRQIVPAMAKLAFLGLRLNWEAVQAAGVVPAASAAGIPLTTALLELPNTEADYRNAVAGFVRDGASGIMVGDSPDTLAHRALIVELIAKTKLPAVYALPEFVEAGGLVAYSFDLVGLNQRAAQDIDAILRGAYPGDIPYFQSSTFKLYINLATAKSLELKIPPALLAQADDVIE